MGGTTFKLLKYCKMSSKNVSVASDKIYRHQWFEAVVYYNIELSTYSWYYSFNLVHVYLVEQQYWLKHRIDEIMKYNLLYYCM